MKLDEENFMPNIIDTNLYSISSKLTEISILSVKHTE